MRQRVSVFTLTATLCLLAALSRPSIAATPLPGQPTTWHDGFARYDYVMDEQTHAITPFTRPADEHFGLSAPPAGQRRCVVIVPKHAAAGNPWTWRGCYWDHEPQAEVELLRRGFHVAYITPAPDKCWDAWYAWLTQHGLSKRPAFVGMSMGGVNSYDWATAHPDEVSCIYADNPAIRPAALQRLDALAHNNVPLLHVCGSLDYLYANNTLAIEARYLQLRGRISVILKQGMAHHPHSLQDPKPIADWIEKNAEAAPIPHEVTWDGVHLARSFYYGRGVRYRYLPADHAYATFRGPAFVPCYDRYDVQNSMTWANSGTTVIKPITHAAGKPWVFRADRIDRHAAVDQALLAKGYEIVIAPITEQSGPVARQWDEIYHVMITHGYSPRPIVAGFGAAAGEAIAWAGRNVDKVGCVYADRPILRDLMFKTPLDPALTALAKAKVPLVIRSAPHDPWRGGAESAQKTYTDAGGPVTIINTGDTGEQPLTSAAVDRIVQSITPQK